MNPDHDETGAILDSYLYQATTGRGNSLESTGQPEGGGRRKTQLLGRRVLERNRWSEGG